MDFHVGMNSIKRVIIFVLPLTAALQQYAFPVSVGGVTFFLFRLLVIGGLIATPFLAFRLHWWKNQVARFYTIMGFIWITWASLSLYWTPALVPAITDIAAIAFGFGVGILLLNVGAASRYGFVILRRGWLLAFAVTAAVAVWELTTGNHLPSAHVESSPDYALRFIAISTFGNPNNYGAFIVLAFPFIISAFHDSDSRLIRFISLIFIFSSFVLVFLTASRSSTAGLAIQVLVYIFVLGGPKRYAAAFTMAGLGIIVLSWFGISLEDFRLWTKLLTAISGEEVNQQGSLGLRLSLTLNGLWMTVQSLGAGMGAASYRYVMESGMAPLPTKHLYAPHNFLIEVVSQYGILVGTLFLAFMTRGTLLGFREWRRYGGARGEMIILMAVGYLFASVANSTYLNVSANWAFIGSFMCVAAYLHDKHRKATAASET